MRYEISYDEKQLNEAISLFEFIGGNSDDAVRVAINKSTTPVRQLAQTRIREQINLKASYVKGRLKVTKATNKNLVGKILTNPQGILLSRFSTDAAVRNFSGGSKPEEPARGIRVKVKPKGATKSVSGKPGEIDGKPFFMILPKSGALAIVGRKTTLGKRGGKIKVFSGPSVSQVFTDVKDEVLPEATKIYTTKLLEAINFLLIKKYPQE